MMRFVENISQLTQAPPELSARIVRGIPQEVAKSAAPYRARGESKIGKDGSCLA
jgi:hypothetical protein